MLIEKGITGNLWIYNNQDKDFEYLPDQIINIKHAAGTASYRYDQIGIQYGKTNGKVWGTISKYAEEENKDVMP